MTTEELFLLTGPHEESQALLPRYIIHNFSDLMETIGVSMQMSLLN